MTHAWMVLLLALQGGADLRIERKVTLIRLDLLGRRREIRRDEVLHLKGGNLAIEDLTFGERLIVRADRKLVWKADPLGGEYSETTFDEVAALRERTLADLRAVKARVPGTSDETELASLLEGLDAFEAAPKVELRSEGPKREVILNGNLVRLSVEVDPAVLEGTAWLASLASLGAFHPDVAGKIGELGGLPLKGTVRYVLFTDRVIERFETTSVVPGGASDGAFELPPGLTRVALEGVPPRETIGEPAREEHP